MYRNLPDDGDGDDSILDHRLCVRAGHTSPQFRHPGPQLGRHWNPTAWLSPPLDLHHRNYASPVPGWVRCLLTGCPGRWLGFAVRRNELQGNPDSGTDVDRRRGGRSDTATAGRRLRTARQQETQIDLAESDGRHRLQNSVLADRTSVDA